jgi:hypothetical protein
MSSAKAATTSVRRPPRGVAPETERSEEVDRMDVPPRVDLRQRSTGTAQPHPRAWRHETAEYSSQVQLPVCQPPQAAFSNLWVQGVGKVPDGRVDLQELAR